MINDIELIGYIAGALALIAWIPQFQTVWVKRLHQGLDIRTLVTVLLALVVWCVYGYLEQAWAVCISNMISGSIIISIIARVWWLRKCDAYDQQLAQDMRDRLCAGPEHITPEDPEPQTTTPDKLLEPEFPWGPRVPPKCPVQKFKDDLSNLEQN